MNSDKIHTIEEHLPSHKKKDTHTKLIELILTNESPLEYKILKQSGARTFENEGEFQSKPINQKDLLEKLQERYGLGNLTCIKEENLIKESTFTIYKTERGK